MDTTIIYYTANRIPDAFADMVRQHLLWSSGGMPIICVTQKPLSFGSMCIHVPHLHPSCYNAYYQMLLGAENAKTKYVACAEDDCLYIPDHFNFEPRKPETFYYNGNVWRARPNYFYARRNGLMMGQCIAPRDLFVDTLRLRFKTFPIDTGELMGEPGKHEQDVGLPPVNFSRFETKIPTVNIKHHRGIMPLRPMKRHMRTELPFWGDAKDLWNKFVGEKDV